ncbi:MAG: glycosyltransferase [Clostridiales bacterium]|nr:glycosyltransferase [Clostridiales bacterium]
MSFENPAISIAIPAYNAGKHLPGCLDSVVSQSFADWELIIADDGSSDGTGKIADEYAANDKRIRVIHTERQGVSAARNLCIENSRGRYIAFVDADDSLEPDYLKELYSYAEQSDSDIIQCSFCSLDKEGNKIMDPDANEAVYSNADEILRAYFRGQQGDVRVSVWAKLFRMESFSDIRFDTELRVYEDAYFVYHCCRKANKVCSFSSPLYHYVQHEGSTTHSRLPEIWSDYFTMYERQKTDFPDNRYIRNCIERREAETGLWLMRILTGEGEEQSVWEIREKVKKMTRSVWSSSAPFSIKMKLAAVSLTPHIYFAMLKKKDNNCS